MSPDRRLWSEALAAFLRTNPAAWAVGRGQAPGADREDRPFPYYVVYSIPGGSYGTDLSGFGHYGLVYQVNGVGRQDDQAELLGDVARGLLLANGGHPTGFQAPDGWRLMGVDPDGEGPGGTEYSGSGVNRIYTMSERYVLRVTPG